MFCRWSARRGAHDGCTALVAILDDDKLYIANTGDSRAVICNSRQGPVRVTAEHKPDRPDELRRLSAAGATVTGLSEERYIWPFGRRDVPRVEGYLAMSRALGNYHLKKFIIPDPEVIVHKLQKEDKTLVLASDGLWDYISNDDVCQTVLSIADPQEAAQRLVERAFNRGSEDNITVIVVDLQGSAVKEVAQEGAWDYLVRGMRRLLGKKDLEKQADGVVALAIRDLVL